MTDTVWVSLAPASAEPIKAITTDITDRDLREATSFASRNDKGDPLPRECFPQRAQLDKNVDRPDNLNRVHHLFRATAGFWFVSEQCAEVFRRFDMGQGALYPVEVFELDGETPVKDRYFCLNFGNSKDVFVPGDAKSLRKSRMNQQRRILMAFAVDGDVTVTSAALIGPDLWCAPHLLQAFFLSNRLAEALRQAGCDKPFFLRRCTLV